MTSTTFTRCSRSNCGRRVGSYIRTLCADGDSPDFGKSIKIEIPDGYVIILPSEEKDETNELCYQIECLRRAVQKLGQDAIPPAEEEVSIEKDNKEEAKEAGWLRRLFKGKMSDICP